jgi:TP901-1 family phage major tail protein|tara:strand:- start:578 stop:982 length:405 start_codon:yes stop_codon:yes gene_type:complete
MAVFNGTNLGVYVGSTIIAAATDCSLSLNMDTIDITTKDSAGYRELLAGLRSGSMSCNGLIDYQSSNTDTVDLVAAWTNRTALTLKFSNELTGDQSYTASGFLTSLEQSGGTEDTATYSASFELSGVVTPATIA